MSPQQIVETMYANDAFSQWLGIEIVAVGVGTAVLRMTIRPDMTNGFGIAHGGISYSLADSALAFASNSHGRMAVSIETAISHTAALKVGDVVVARAELEHLSHKTGLYRVAIVREELGDLVAVFKGTVYRKEKEWANPTPAS
jgi:acyl-CoA thioesterase